MASVQPCRQWMPLSLMERGGYVAGQGEAFVAGMPASVGMGELDCVADAMEWEAAQLHLRRLPDEEGPGNAVLITLGHEQVTEVFTGFGAKAMRAEAVARAAIAEARAYLASGAAVGEYLADQLLLPMALADGGRFTASTVSSHAATNAHVIARFLPVGIHFERR